MYLSSAIADILPLRLSARPARLWWDALRSRLARVQALQSQRRDLARLDARLLRDVGISQEEARREAAKPPWRL